MPDWSGLIMGYNGMHVEMIVDGHRYEGTLTILNDVAAYVLADAIGAICPLGLPVIMIQISSISSISPTIY